MSAATRSGRSRRTPTLDRLCAEAVDLAREAVEYAAPAGTVGAYLEAVADADRVVTHYFTCLDSAYRGWRWAATVTRAARAKSVTVDETVLMPGADALLAPEWLPWSERLRPGDLGPGDLLPTEADDLRLEPGFMGDQTRPVNAPVEAVEAEAEPLAEMAEAAEAAEAAETAGVAGVAEVAEAEDADIATGSPRQIAETPVRGTIAAVAEELGMARRRVLSRYGLHSAAERWEEEYGPETPMAQSAPANCVSCGFLMPLSGSMRQAFGVCANEYSPADGHVVSLAYGCGGHSEAAVMPKAPQPPPPVIDETQADAMSLGGGAGSSPSPPSSDSSGSSGTSGQSGS
jgi:hypothetical protein